MRAGRSAQQQRRLLTLTVDERLFWGNALNPLDKRVTATDSDDGFILDGIKSFSSGTAACEGMCSVNEYLSHLG